MVSLKNLTIEEKLRLLCGGGPWATEEIPGKVEKITVSDGPIGLNTRKPDENGEYVAIPAVVFPSIQMLANTWDRKSAEKMGQMLADEAIERDIDILLAPGVNIKRHPLNGRNFEYFSEDPFLSGTLAGEYISGLQNCGVGVCLKHFAANNMEYCRTFTSSEIDDRTLREIYYKPFELACKSKPVSIMCSYNRINGVYAAENKKGFDILRNEYGFDGVVISDWGAVHDRTESVKAGLDLEMPFMEDNYKKFVDDFYAGRISEAELDVSVQRMLDLIAKMNEKASRRSVKTSKAQRVDAAKSIAAEGMVLLKNNGILPLKQNKSVAVSGCYAKPDDKNILLGGGSAVVLWEKEDTFDLPAELTKLGYDVSYDPAFFTWENARNENAYEALMNAAKRDIAIVCCGTGSQFEFESGDRRNMKLESVQVRAIKETAKVNPNTVVVIFAGAAIETREWENDVAAIVYAGFPGIGGDAVLADILTGKINPSGKLSETFPVVLEDVPAVKAYRDIAVARYQEGLDVGYRYFDSYRVPVSYPFGYGLSYSKFVYKNLEIAAAGNRLKICYEIENASAIDGKEISQIYVGQRAPLVYRPKKELKGYSKDFVKAGKTVKIKAELGIDDFAYWSTVKDCWITDDGVYDVYICSDSATENLHARVLIEKRNFML